MVPCLQDITSPSPAILSISSNYATWLDDSFLNFNVSQEELCLGREDRGIQHRACL